MSQITTHVLDTARGKPAEGIQIVLYRQAGHDWIVIADGATNKDGRIADLLAKDRILPIGIYKMEFMINNYFEQLGQLSFYPVVPVIFNITTSEHYHIPLLLSPFGYSTYRGS